MIHIKKQAGFSLLEYLISSLLGLLLIGTLIQVYLSAKKTYQLQHALNFIQENGRFAAYFLSTHIHMAGFALCQDVVHRDDQDEVIRGYSTHHLPEFLRNNAIVKNTDVLVIKRCEKMSDKAQQQYLKIAFFIAETSYKNLQGLPVYGLYEKKISPQGAVNTQEVISGVENMRIYYGLTDPLKQNIVTYRTIDQMQLNDWPKVRSVQINLLFNSLDNVLLRNESYTFHDKKIPGDRKLHQEWDVYVGLRNV